MRAARMHDYKQPLVLEEVPVPEPGPTEVLLKVAAVGMCRSDWQLMDGYFKPGSRWLSPTYQATRSRATSTAQVPMSRREPVFPRETWSSSTPLAAARCAARRSGRRAPQAVPGRGLQPKHFAVFEISQQQGTHAAWPDCHRAQARIPPAGIGGATRKSGEWPRPPVSVMRDLSNQSARHCGAPQARNKYSG